MRKVNVFKIIFLFLFTAVIIVPVATMDVLGGGYSPIEQRNLAVFPLNKNREIGGKQSWCFGLDK